MTSRDFCYWLQGYFELGDQEEMDAKGISAKQTAVIRNHLAMVFHHEIDPSFGGLAKREELSDVHETGEFIATAPSRWPSGPKINC